jgi:2',3'-cyclic-nucleotide 2'-phosphodiesterase (5'-nucleotidase family)
MMQVSTPIKLTILHTNDLHGRVTQLTRIATLVREIRREVDSEGGFCLYVDAGDSEDTIQLESSLTKGSSMNAMLRGAGCEYAALGNAIPIRYGPQAIADMAKQFGKPLICANFMDENLALVMGLESFTIHNFGVFKLGIIGLTDAVKTYASIFHLHPQKPEDILPDLIRQARGRGAQTILLLSHLGLNQDKSLIEKAEGVDLIIGGHSHDALNTPLNIHGTIIAQTGDFGRFLGRVDLEIDPVSGKIIHYEGRLLSIDESIPPDSEAVAAVESERNRVQQIMNNVVGTLDVPFDLANDRECAAGNLLADALLERVRGAEIALVLAGHWETGLSAGVLTQGQLFAANRSTANPAKVELTGEQILQFLGAALKPGNAEQSHHSLRGRKMGFPHIAGMTIDGSPLNPEMLKAYVADRPLIKSQTYTVATTDMELSDWVNYLVVPDEQVEYEVPTIMPEVLEDYITKHSPVPSPTPGRITILPV